MKRTTAVAAVLLVSLAGALPVAAETEEGIRVHGHWKIEILEPDGTLVSVTEFENALMNPDGQIVLVATLAGQAVVGTFAVMLEDGVGTGPCDDGGGLSVCMIVESGSTWSGFSPDSFNLQIIATTTLVLEGSVTAVHAAPVSEVLTGAKLCGSGVSPDTCFTTLGTAQLFTSTVLPSPVPVDAGQIIQVTVTISFS